MTKNLLTLTRYFLFWILFFLLERLIFVLAFLTKLKDVAAIEIIKSFIIGLWMDASMAAYISATPLLVTVVVWLLPGLKIPVSILRGYNHVLIVVFSIICVFNFNIYREWGSKINFKALDFAFHSPNEALASSASSPIITSLLVLGILIITSLWLAKKIICYKRFQYVNVPGKIIVSILLLGLNFLFIRGGWQLSPMNESMAYYSKTQVLNHAAINTEWALMRDVLNNQSNKSPYHYYNENEVRLIVDQLFPVLKQPSQKILLSSRPNVVLIIMESFTAGIVQSLGGEKGITPEFDKLASQGLLFENIYASGDRTDKGVVAVLNGFPSQAIRSIMKLNSKQEKLPSISQELVKAGYTSAFFYGGESEFFNMKSYILSHNYQQLVDKRSFDKKDMNSKWGAFDDVVYKNLIGFTKISSKPFFHTLLTLTNHEPFQVPGTPRFNGEEIENKFRSTAFYADSCLGAFLKNSKNEDWYENTLFIIVADHGHRLPGNSSEIYHPNRFRIPLIFYGNVIKPEFRGRTISKVGNQTDIAATLLAQLQLSSEQFKWSRDLVNDDTQNFAFFNWDNGFGVATDHQIISFDNTGKSILFKKKLGKTKENERLLRFGKAYMQQVYQQYLDY